MLGNRNLTRILLTLFVGLCIDTFKMVSSADRSDGNGRSCFDVDNKQICYFRPNLTNKNDKWTNAWKACKEANSTLPVIENQRIQTTLEKYLELQKPPLSGIWLAGRKTCKDWRWLNETKLNYQGRINGSEKNETTHAVLTEQLEYSAENPNSTYNYICQYPNNTQCESQNATRFENGCIVIHSDEQLNYFEARIKCLNGEGDLACIAKEKEDLSLRLVDSRKYWIGLRRTWWIWNATEPIEMKYSNWLKYENLNENCSYIGPNGYKWNQGRCNDSKKIHVLCQTVKAEFTTQGGREESILTSTLSQQETGGISTGLLVGITIGTIISLVIIVAFTIMLRKSCRKNVNDKHQTSDENPTHPDENKGNQEVAEMCNVYAEITGIHGDQGSDGNEPRRDIVYAELEFSKN